MGSRKDGGASGGHDLPAFDNLAKLKTWADEGPPKGTLYMQGEPLEKTLAWAEGEVGGYLRT